MASDYRIKHPSESRLSLYDTDHIPEPALEYLAITSTDKNIVPGTCAYIQKVQIEDKLHYLCNIKYLAARFDLEPGYGLHSNKVDGAERFTDGPEWATRRFFTCKYVDSSSADLSRDSDNTVLCSRCHCYSPRGGMVISLADGAVKGNLATGNQFSYEVPNAHDVWLKSKETGRPPSWPQYPDSAPKEFSEGAVAKVPAYSGSLGMLFQVLNARALRVPCCYWVRGAPLVYRSSYFKVVDLAVAQAAVGYVDAVQMSKELGVSDHAEYNYTPGDFWYQGDALIGEDGSPKTIGEHDAFLLNKFQGRHYDWTLPETANNKRIIYVLDPAIVGYPTKYISAEDKANNCPSVWHYDTPQWFNPRNCGHPDGYVRYTWGHVCNGGGSYDLAEGKACPYYRSAIIGDSTATQWHLRLEDLYPGSTINAATVLQLMWLCKGGLPWTQAEWESTWLVPYVWTTTLVNPVSVITNETTDQSGNTIYIEGAREYKVFARKASISLSSGEVSLGPIQELPGGSASNG